MTQSPFSGQAAPPSTDLGSGTAPRQATGNGSGEAPAGSTSPNTPAASTPWGTTSRATGSGQNPYASGAPVFSSTPLSGAQADAPTASVPHFQDVPPPGRGGPNSAAGRTAPPRGARARGPRRARLQLRNVNPWTVLKFSCVLSIALFFVWLIVIGVLFGVLDAAGVIGKINSAYTTIQGNAAKPPVTATWVFGGAAIIGLVNIVLFIALTTVGSIVYNLCADLVGGIEITLSER
jgi:Transmembrane domain of unknown function (DUF3566)